VTVRTGGDSSGQLENE
jgi:hypothetical protein